MRIAAAFAGSVLLVGVTTVLVVQSRADEVIYRTESEFNTIVVTENSDGIRTLRFADYGARQSVVKLGDPDYIELPYAKAMQVGLAAADDPKRVLIVGLGGGTIPQFLRHHFPKLQIDVVELDPGRSSSREILLRFPHGRPHAGLRRRRPKVSSSKASLCTM